MARDFVSCDRGQLLLMPPSLTEWLPENHLVWTVLGAVDQMDLGRFREAYRLGAAGRAPLDPAMMVALLLYAYARGIRSSRGIERACWEGGAVKVIAGMRPPAHSTIAGGRRQAQEEPAVEMEVDLEQAVLARPVLRRNGRREWFRVARSELEAHRTWQAQPIPRDRDDRLLEMLERFEENQRVDLAANEAYER